MNKLNILVGVALMAALTSCGQTEKLTKSNMNYIADYSIVNPVRRGDIISGTTTTFVYNKYNVVTDSVVMTIMSTVDRVTELHADGSITFDTVRIVAERKYPMELVYKCDINLIRD